ncbi:hypothetical protein A5740_02265 [Mycobacterium sp. GA-1841]|uniref:hypothetical protein n=1 Tax=Mycobacterium sp. GA-1841 TaxID=1834154 RepID=UPI00096F37F6|nr:hypothetical protein [Mycobacterium sp. GA-1841]OMC38898.1 hypothetical protein A5740_02265 [Mycobacterium sp. GA-1841]
MDVEETEPIPTVTTRAEQIRGQLTPSRVIAGVSTTVAVVAVAALIGVTTKRPDTAPAENTSPAVAASPPVVHTPATGPAEAPAPAEPVAARSVTPNLEALLPTSPSTSAPKPPAAATSAIDSGGGLADIFAVPNISSDPAVSAAPPAPAVSAAPPAAAVSPPAQLPAAAAPAWPTFDFGTAYDSWQTAAAAANAAPAVNAVISAVTGTTGWVGNGALNVLADFLITWANQNGQNPWGNPAVPPADSLAALMLGPAVTAGANIPTVDWTKVPPPQLAPIDWTKVPPPQLPSIDWTKIPPPQLPPIDWTKIPPPQLPHFEDPFAKLPSITRAIGLPF